MPGLRGRGPRQPARGDLFDRGAPGRLLHSGRAGVARGAAPYEDASRRHDDQPAVGVRQLHDRPVSLRERVRARRPGDAAPESEPRPRRSDRRLTVIAILAVLGLVAAAGIAAVSTDHVVVPVPGTETTLGRTT